MWLRCERSRFSHVIPQAELLADGLRWDAANSSVCRSGLPVGCTTGPGHHDQASTWQTEAPLFYRTMLKGNIIHSHDNEPVNTHPLCGWACWALHTHIHTHAAPQHDQHTPRYYTAEQVKKQHITTKPSVWCKRPSPSRLQGDQHTKRVPGGGRLAFNIYCSTWQCFQTLYWLFNDKERATQMRRGAGGGMLHDDK